MPLGETLSPEFTLYNIKFTEPIISHPFFCLKRLLVKVPVVRATNTKKKREIFLPPAGGVLFPQGKSTKKILKEGHGPP